jgi:glycosyltransferase involved in cell wall biosynthesis
LAGEVFMTQNQAFEMAMVIPCYNEATRLPVGDFKNYISRQDNPCHFLFVNDGSTDATDSVLGKLASEYKDAVSVLNLKQNVGKAEAVRLGFKKLLTEDYKYIGFWDADLATPLEAVDELASVLYENQAIEMMMGARCKLLGRDVRRKLSRHYLGRLFATVVSVTLKIGVYDTQCGAKMFKVSDKTKAVFQEPFISRWIFDVEIISRLIRNNGRKYVESSIYEYPLKKWIHIEGSKVKPADFFKAFFELVKIKQKYLR